MILFGNLHENMCSPDYGSVAEDDALRGSCGYVQLLWLSIEFIFCLLLEIFMYSLHIQMSG